MRGIFIYRYYIIYARFCHPLLFLRAHSYVKFNVYVKKLHPFLCGMCTIKLLKILLIFSKNDVGFSKLIFSEYYKKKAINIHLFTFYRAVTD